MNTTKNEKRVGVIENFYIFAPSNFVGFVKK